MKLTIVILLSIAGMFYRPLVALTAINIAFPELINYWQALALGLVFSVWNVGNTGIISRVASKVQCNGINEMIGGIIGQLSALAIAHLILVFLVAPMA